MIPARSRGQANLLSLAVALVALLSATTLGLVVADGALADADRDPLERRTAVTAADRLVSAPATTVRPNVLDAAALRTVSDRALAELAPPTEGRAVRLDLDGETVFERGDPTGGTTIQRIVLVAEPTIRTRTVAVEDGSGYTLSRRTSQVTITFDGNSTVETVRLNGRVVLHDPDGLAGRFSVSASRYETATLGFAGGSASVRVENHPFQTRKATLRVTVDA